MRATRADVEVARRAFKQVWLGATICAIAFGATAASSALTYVTSFPSASSRHQLAVTTGSDAGLSVLLGPVGSIDTVGGYTVYKGFVFLTTIGAIWGMLAATRLLRGEEDAGRWQLLLAGTTRPAQATTATLSALGAAIGVLFAGTTLLVVWAGRNPDVGFSIGECVLYGLSIAIPPAVFVAVGAVTAQLGRTRRTATTLGVGVFGVAFALRMVADAGFGTRWLSWATPFGWTERVRPFTANNLTPLAPAAIAVGVLCVGAIMLASKRDVGDGVLATRDVAPLRPFGLRSAFTLGVRLERGTLLAWCSGVLASGFLLGVIAKMTTADLPDSFRDTLGKLGVHGSFAAQYLGVAFLLVATVVALLPAGPIGAMGDEETSGRAVHVLAGTTSRTTWFVGRLAVIAVVVVAAGLLAGFGAWFGAASQGVDVSLASLLGAGLNVVPTALLVLGIGAAVLAIAPRAAAAAIYGVVTWSVLADLFGSLVSRMKWLERTSLFHYMPLAPAQALNATSAAVATAAGLGLCMIACLLFRRRDLQTA